MTISDMIVGWGLTALSELKYLIVAFLGCTLHKARKPKFDVEMHKLIASQPITEILNVVNIFLLVTKMRHHC